MAIFGFSLEDLKEILNELEARIIARINQLEIQIINNGKELEKLKSDLKELHEAISQIQNKKSKSKKQPSNKIIERNDKILQFLSTPHNTKEVCEKFGYSRSYASFLLNSLKKQGLIKVHNKVGNIPYFIKKLNGGK